MVLLMYRERTFCQCFFRRETKKLIAKWMFCTSWSSSISRFPMATLKHKTFFIWNLMVLCKSLIFSSKLSPWVSREGNLPALLRPGPKSLGICLIRDSEARNASYFLASFLTSFFCLFNFFKSSALMWGIPASLASSQCCWSPKMQTENFGLGIWRNLQE